ncbi:MAG: WYL domain-containing protein, partial [Epsilonproteobacteria bacterium]|nr:WYL domain-containing protein [Campylobacterota bacterium]
YELLNYSSDGLTISELSSELSVSTKTIQRDLYEVLAEYGAVKNGRVWKIDKKQASDALGPSEKIILGILDKMAKGSGKTFYGKAHSLLAKMTQQLEQPIFTNMDSETLDDGNLELFITLEKSIKNKQEISFIYKKHLFTLKPLKLAFFDGFWYLLAFDSKDNDKFKKFHLKSISELTLLENSFSISSDIENRLTKANSIWFELDKELFDVNLLIDKDIAKYFIRKPLKTQTIVGEDKDSSLEIALSISDEMEILPIIFWYIPHVKVLSPDWLADIVKTRVGEYHKEL